MLIIVGDNIIIAGDKKLLVVEVRAIASIVQGASTQE